MTVAGLYGGTRKLYLHSIRLWLSILQACCIWNRREIAGSWLSENSALYSRPSPCLALRTFSSKVVVLKSCSHISGTVKTTSVFDTYCIQSGHCSSILWYWQVWRYTVDPLRMRLLTSSELMRLLCLLHWACSRPMSSLSAPHYRSGRLRPFIILDLVSSTRWESE